ncbi:MAG TPA: hypothetical protein VLE99_06300 [Candidatus Saccharimonadales bacterium]|nr:hypothetical protein [Candidatus Saccharimonadales bacterium]
MKRGDYIAYWFYIALGLSIIFIVVASNPAMLLLLGAAASAALLMAYSVTGILKRQPVATRSLIWRIVGALPLIAGAAFIGFWMLLILGVMIFGLKF